ncbi:Wiskott-Aldrich syndrome protein family member [Elysia marginata]|uniref:Wiskott-Aldrich syndrome protein family member n=1 Tax=Elysia marginata TaxID=1093978 RepID=A0AAV4F2K2_9GAST|nr:Wiskott-Aldrich syndrome protein family member [Elysia marginata]
MPHIKRLVEPTLVSRVPVDPAVRDELEFMTNGTLANLIRDLSSLSKHAEDMFRELSTETLEVCRRASGLQRRIEDVHDKVTRLNPNMDVLDLQSINLLKPFMSSNTKEQQVLSRSTVPRAILEIYERCDPSPALNKLDQFREDGKSSMKFYTDPLYFEELWAIEMGKQFEENRKKANQKKNERTRQQPTRGRDKVKQAEAKSKEKAKKYKDGVEFASDYQDPATLKIKIERDQEEARRLRAQHEHDQMIAKERQKQQEYQQQLQEAKRQSHAQRKQMLQQQQLQDNYYPNQTHNNNMYVEDGNMEQAYTQHIPYNNGQAGLPANHQHHHLPHEDTPPPPPQHIEQRPSPGKVPNGSVGNKRDTISSPNRPMAPPPAPPTANTSSRNSLPPPPSPPPPMEIPPRQPSMSPQGSRRGMLQDSR